MDYREAANFLFDLRRFRMKPGTEATAKLLAHLGNPHKGHRFVQIAGSNGKGSTARMVDTICREAGLTVGLYTSPHADDVRERIRVNDRMIPKSAVRTFVETSSDYLRDQAADGSAPTFFEVMTAMALWYFDRQDVDLAVLEVGIGGRYDATSVVSPAASAVTAVTLEHTDVLGESIEEIAKDKAQVAPDDGPLVTAATGEARDAIHSSATDVVTVGNDGTVSVTYNGLTDRYEGDVTISGPDWSVSSQLAMAGAHQAHNAAIAATLARQLTTVGPESIAKGLHRARWPGRFEIVSRSPLVVFDGAHNPGACSAIANTISEVDYDNLIIVFGAMNNKDHGGMADALPSPSNLIACRPALDRSADPHVLARVFERRGTDVQVIPAVGAAALSALETASPADCVLITGSLYTVGEARRRWIHRPMEIDRGHSGAIGDLLKRAHVTPDHIDRIVQSASHRVITLRIGQRDARRLRDQLQSVGGTVAVSGIESDHEPVEVVCSATSDQYERMIDSLGPPATDPLTSLLNRALEPAISLEAMPWDAQPAIMGILNVTPDSFHDGGEYIDPDDAVQQAASMATAGATIIDIGGESTRPGAEPVAPETEIQRIVPVIEALADRDIVLSVDTRKAGVADAALSAGADMLNDVSGLEDPEMPAIAASHDVPLAVMHSIDAPVVPDRDIVYDDVVSDVRQSLAETLLRAEAAGLDRSQLLVDPGLGFGKSASESFELLDRLYEFRSLGCPVLVGHSHKSMFGAIDRYPDTGGYATVAATTLAAERGASVIRVHDVPENVAAVRTLMASQRGATD